MLLSWVNETRMGVFFGFGLMIMISSIKKKSGRRTKLFALDTLCDTMTISNSNTFAVIHIINGATGYAL